MVKSLLVTLDYPPQVGGVAVYYEHLAGEFPDGRIMVLTAAEVYGRKIQETPGVFRRAFLFKSKLFWPKWLPMLWQIWKITRQNKIKLIQVGQILPVGTAVYILNKFFKIPYMVYCHGMDVMTAAQSPRKKRLARKILNKSEFIVANSEFTKEKILEYGARAQDVAVVYPCPNMKLFRKATPQEIDALKSKYNLRGKKIILTAGRLVERKGHDVVLGALHKLNESAPEAHYVIIGEGPMEEVIKQMIKTLGLEDSVTLIGKVSDHDLAIWYEVCDVFVMISRQLKNEDAEGFGIVYLEANMFGKPVIAGKSGGAAEAVLDNETGILVEPTNQQEIINAIEKILKNPVEARRLGENGRRRAEQDFQWSKQAKPLIERIMKYE
ncbi:glycosyltransferase family 1 protein [Patescibacteria group bacterium]|nr:MAG: glycosyltransferase family 1 protein [Patescibacteria group bacterium]